MEGDMDALSASDVAGLSLEEISQISAADISSLSPEAMAGFTAEGMAALPPDTFGALTADQVSNIPELSFEYVNADQIGALTMEAMSGVTELQVGNLAFHQPDVFFSAEQISNMADLPTIQSTMYQYQMNGGELAQSFTASDMQHFSPEMMNWFPTAFVGELSPEVFGALTADQVSNIQPNDFQYLSYDQVSSFSADGLSGLTELQINAMSLQPELPLWFTDEQVANMSTDAAAAFQIMVDTMSGGTQVAPDTTHDVSNQNSNAEPEPADDGTSSVLSNSTSGDSSQNSNAEPEPADDGISGVSSNSTSQASSQNSNPEPEPLNIEPSGASSNSARGETRDEDRSSTNSDRQAREPEGERSASQEQNEWTGEESELSTQAFITPNSGERRPREEREEREERGPEANQSGISREVPQDEAISSSREIDNAILAIDRTMAGNSAERMERENMERGDTNSDGSDQVRPEPSERGEVV
jgi:hypothetical protein